MRVCGERYAMRIRIYYLFVQSLRESDLDPLLLFTYHDPAISSFYLILCALCACVCCGLYIQPVYIQ